VHPCAGWLEGGSGVPFEKLITDIEALQTVAELCDATPGDEDAIGFDAIAEVQPGGHFSSGHTMARYAPPSEPLGADWSNFSIWTQARSKPRRSVPPVSETDAGHFRRRPRPPPLPAFSINS
jgi:trimethylamine--corrinoid protein Co-methyltransferase